MFHISALKLYSYEQENTFCYAYLSLISLQKLLTADSSVALQQTVYHTDHHFIVHLNPAADKSQAGEMMAAMGIYLLQFIVYNVPVTHLTYG